MSRLCTLLECLDGSTLSHARSFSITQTLPFSLTLTLSVYYRRRNTVQRTPARCWCWRCRCRRQSSIVFTMNHFKADANFIQFKLNCKLKYRFCLNIWHFVRVADVIERVYCCCAPIGRKHDRIPFCILCARYTVACCLFNKQFIWQLLQQYQHTHTHKVLARVFLHPRFRLLLDVVIVHDHFSCHCIACHLLLIFLDKISTVCCVLLLVKPI